MGYCIVLYCIVLYCIDPPCVGSGRQTCQVVRLSQHIAGGRGRNGLLYCIVLYCIVLTHPASVVVGRLVRSSVSPSTSLAGGDVMGYCIVLYCIVLY